MDRNNEMILSMRRADTVLSENVAVIGSKNKTSLMDLKRLSEIVAQKKNTSILVPSARRFDVLSLSFFSVSKIVRLHSEKFEAV